MAETRQSRQIGRRLLTVAPVATSVMVYEALVPLVCASCEREIPAGELFSREHISGGGKRLFPCCHACKPFVR